MNKLIELVSEVVSSSNSQDYLSSQLEGITGKHKSNYDTFEDYLEACEKDIYVGLWHSAFHIDYPSYLSNTNTSSNPRYHYDKMSITKWIAKPIEEIGNDKTFYFIGKRFTKVSVINALCDHYNWTWEKIDPSKADFFILGDNPSVEEAKLNLDLSKPVLMDEDLRYASHFLFNEEVTIDEIDNDLISEYLDKVSYSNLTLVASMIQYLKEGVLSDANRYRLIRSYVKTFEGRAFDLSNKEHVWLSDTVLNYCHRQHRNLVTARYLKKSKWDNQLLHLTDSDRLIFNVITYNDLPGYIGSRSKYKSNNFSNIHRCEGMDEVIQSDLESFNSYAHIKLPVFDTNSYYKYLVSHVKELLPARLYEISLSYHESNTNSSRYYVEISEDKFKYLGTAFLDKNNRTSLSTRREIYSDDIWSNEVEPVIERTLLDNLSMDSEGTIFLNHSHLMDLVNLDECLVSNQIQKGSVLRQLKFKARKLAAIGQY
jgi:hypothetical protein